VTTENINLLIGAGQLLLALLWFLNIDRAYVAKRIPNIRVRSAVIYLLIIGGLAFSGFGFYLANKRPKETIVEKPVEKIVEKLVPQECPQTQPVAGSHTKEKPKNLPAPAVPPNTTINAPGGIPIVGNSGTVSNPTVINNGPPPANLSFTEEIISPIPLTGNGEKSMKVHITTDRSIPAAVVGIVFSGPVEMSKGGGQDDPSLRGASIQQLTWGGPLTQRGGAPVPNSFFISVNVPAAFTPGQELIVPVKSKTDVHVLRALPISVGGN